MKSEVEVLIKEILNIKFNIEREDVNGIYKYGSRLYGTHTDYSDWDYVVLVSRDCGIVYEQYCVDDADIHILGYDEFDKRLKACDFMCLQVVMQSYTNEDTIQYGCPIDLEEFEEQFDKWELRKSVSSVVNNSWCKGKKKLINVEEDNYIGVKSIFHSIRLLDYGIQLATFFDRDYFFSFKRTNRLYDDIINVYESLESGYYNDYEGNYYSDIPEDECGNVMWEVLEKRYKSKHEENVKLFRTLCPKPEGF